MEDILLQKMFEKHRWEKAIEIGVGKHIDKGEMRQLCSPQVRAELYLRIKNGKYMIAPPHLQLIPKDKPGEFREVAICENIDRVVLSIINSLFFEMFPHFIHPACKSYQVGIGCGKVVQEVAKECEQISNDIIGKKYDLSKYFDSLAIEYIDVIFDRMEMEVGKSKVIDLVRQFYHCDLLFDVNGDLVEQYKSLKQGVAVSSFLADAALYHIDKEMSKLSKIKYWRYSDDILVIGDNYEEGDALLHLLLSCMGLKINPAKEQKLSKQAFFKFLGFSICGNKISLSSGRIKTFQKEIERRTINDRNNTPLKAVHKVNNYLYHGDEDGHSWATNVLPIINCETDIQELNKFVMDCLRAVETKKRKLGGLGYVPTQKDGVIYRGVGKNVTSNRKKTDTNINKYMSLNCARLALMSDRAVYEALVRQL